MYIVLETRLILIKKVSIGQKNNFEVKTSSLLNNSNDDGDVNWQTTNEGGYGWPQPLRDNN